MQVDYLGRLENSVKNFEAETSKLLKINQLIQETAELTESVADEKKILEKSVAQLEAIQIQLTQNCAKLTEYAENEEAARQKLLADIHKNFLEDSRVVIEKLSLPLQNSNKQLAETCELLKKFIETHQKSQEKFLADIETVLIRYNTKNLEVYNNITATLSNKIEISSGNLETNLNLRLNNFAQDISNLDKKISGVAEEIQPLQEILSTIKYIKIAVSIAAVSGIAACLINFLQ